MKRNPTSGVTLLETMIGLLVMAMVAGQLSAGFGSTARLFGRGALASERIEQALARRDLRIWLEHALPSSAPDDNRRVFAGSSRELVFLTLPPGGSFWEGRATEIRLAHTAASALAVGIDPTRMDERQLSLPLGPASARLSFKFWGRPSAGGQAGWHDNWPPDVGLPELVQVSFEGDGDLPPPLVARPGKAWPHSEMSLSSLVPPALPSLP
jgi:Tfp pilus assembly protein PilV